MYIDYIYNITIRLWYLCRELSTLFRVSPRQLTPVYCARHSQFQSGLTASVNKCIHNVSNKYIIISYINLEIEYYRNYYHESMITHIRIIWLYTDRHRVIDYLAMRSNKIAKRI